MLLKLRIAQGRWLWTLFPKQASSTSLRHLPILPRFPGVLRVWLQRTSNTSQRIQLMSFWLLEADNRHVCRHFLAWWGIFSDGSRAESIRLRSPGRRRPPIDAEAYRHRALWSHTAGFDLGIDGRGEIFRSPRSFAFLPWRPRIQAIVHDGPISPIRYRHAWRRCLVVFLRRINVVKLPTRRRSAFQAVQR